MQDQHNPTVMFNGMLAPVIPYAMRGVLWYQGESITPPKELYPLWNETLIKDWRSLWNREFPFYFCQLAALDQPSNTPQVRAWQAEALQLPQTAMAVTIDIGDKKNVHPKDKQDVGLRLTRIALAKTYGRDIESSGPQPEGVTAEAGGVAHQVLPCQGWPGRQRRPAQDPRSGRSRWAIRRRGCHDRWQ
ncbi:MAG: sialate O-acetylesterase [Chthoniobacteraceae bacterium]